MSKRNTSSPKWLEYIRETKKIWAFIDAERAKYPTPIHHGPEIENLLIIIDRMTDELAKARAGISDCAIMPDKYVLQLAKEALDSAA